MGYEYSLVWTPPPPNQGSTGAISSAQVEHLDYCACDRSICKRKTDRAIFSDCLNPCPDCGDFSGFYPEVGPSLDSTYTRVYNLR